MDFKQSNLIGELEKIGLSDEAWAFIDACTDDWCVDEDHSDESCVHYEVRVMRYGCFNGKEVEVAQIFYGTLEAIAMTIEHLEYEQSLLLDAEVFGSDYESEVK